MKLDDAAPGGGELPDFRVDVDTAVKTIVGRWEVQVAERAAANETIAAMREELRTLGVVPKAFEAALRRKNLATYDDRIAWDRSYAFASRCMGVPLQADLFEK